MSEKAREIIARAICQSGKFETGHGTCAPICMEHLGDARLAPCHHSARLHGKLTDTVITALRDVGYRIAGPDEVVVSLDLLKRLEWSSYSALSFENPGPAAVCPDCGEREYTEARHGRHNKKCELHRAMLAAAGGNDG